MKYKMQSKTVLYIPSEGTNLSVEEVVNNKPLVQRLECLLKE